jgi:TfoX/Sxy family transcriptional regulator of competence genes
MGLIDHNRARAVSEMLSDRLVSSLETEGDVSRRSVLGGIGLHNLAEGLAIGVGAILQVVWELYGMVDRQGRPGTALNYSALL